MYVPTYLAEDLPDCLIKTPSRYLSKYVTTYYYNYYLAMQRKKIMRREGKTIRKKKKTAQNIEQKTHKRYNQQNTSVLFTMLLCTYLPVCMREFVSGLSNLLMMSSKLASGCCVPAATTVYSAHALVVFKSFFY